MQILAIIFVAVKSFATPAHRELIDMVMTVKESGKVSQLDPVSKTKIRGVLALLKHGELLVTQGDYGEPVRLYLAPGIETFKDLRERHDSFLSMYMIDHHLFIPAMLRTELVWQLDEETRLMRLDAMDKLVHKLRYFFGSLAEYSANAIDRDVTDGGGTGSAADPSTGTGNNKLQQQGQGPGYGGAGRGGGRGGAGMVGMSSGRGGNMGMGGRGGYPPYGGPPGGRGGGRYGQYGQYGGHFNAGGGYEGGGGGYGGGGYGSGGGYGGRYTSYATSRAQHQRMANAQASLNWANNEDYAELANDDWSASESGSAKGRSSAAPSGGAMAPLGSGSVTLPMHDSGGLKSSLSPQAPSFDPVQLKPGSGAVSAHKKGPHGGELAGDHLLDFDYTRLSSGGGGATSRLHMLSATMNSNNTLDDSAWLAAATGGSTGAGRGVASSHGVTSSGGVSGGGGTTSSSNYDFWNDSGSSFFNSVAGEVGISGALEGPSSAVSGGGGGLQGQGQEDLTLSPLSSLNLSSRPYQSTGSGKLLLLRYSLIFVLVTYMMIVFRYAYVCILVGAVTPPLDLGGLSLSLGPAAATASTAISSATTDSSSSSSAAFSVDA